MRAIEPKPSSMAAKPPPTALMDASARHASHPLEAHGVEELALEATEEYIIKMVWMAAGSRTYRSKQFLYSCDRPQLPQSERAVDKPLRGAAERHSSEVHRRRRKAVPSCHTCLVRSR